MPADTAANLYEQLAEKYHARGKYPERDRFLILAADAAWNAGATDAAEGLRKRILEYNPNHLLRPYGSFADALKSADILAYVQQLRRGYPRERALELLKELDQDAKGKGGADYQIPVDAGKAGGVFKLADDKATKAPARTQVPPPLSQSQSLHADKPKWATNSAPAPVQPHQGLRTPATARAAAEEPVAGAAIGAGLFMLVGAAALGTLAYVFVWPFFRS